MKKALIYTSTILLLIVVFIYLSGNSHLFKAIQSTYLIGKTGPTIDDFEKFYNRKVSSGDSQPWAMDSKFNEYGLSEEDLKILGEYHTLSFLVIHKDSILFEKYWEGYSETSHINSFSVAKSLVSIAIGVAIKEGYIKGLSQKVSDFLPEFKHGLKSQISIKDLLSMSSGIDFGESYDNPLGFMAKSYYGNEIYDISVDAKMEYTAGKIWKYQGGNTLLLSFILEKATSMSLSEYFSEKVWKPIGAEQTALWSLSEENGHEKAFCCFYSNARDFARIGKLYLQNGRWGNDTLVPFWYVKESVMPVNIPDKKGKNVDHYGYHWWLTDDGVQQIFYARGIQGQYIVVLPKDDLIIVRLGRKRDPKRNAIVPADLLEYIKMSKSILAESISG